MTNNHTASMDLASDRPPAFHVRRLREAYGEVGLTTNDLAELAGLPRPLVDSFEQATAVPAFLQGLLRIAFALQVPLEALIDERHLVRARAGIARRRQQREGGDRRPIGFSVSEA